MQALTDAERPQRLRLSLSLLLAVNALIVVTLAGMFVRAQARIDKLEQAKAHQSKQIKSLVGIASDESAMIEQMITTMRGVVDNQHGLVTLYKHARSPGPSPWPGRALSSAARR